VPALQPVRGTHDLLPDEMARHRQVVEVSRAVAETYGYRFMATPVFEFTEVFERTLGETSDVVTKEMYTFAMKEGERITLRPENTASVVRAMLSNGLQQSLPLKYFYAGPMFRHERPQKGRQRQFHQIGIELLGVADPAGDIEVIACGADTLEALGLLEGTRLELNTLGDMESRKAYRAALLAYFRDHQEKLSPESRERLERNPLRILDSKQRDDRRIIAEAPSFHEYLNQASQDFFGVVREGLDVLGISYEVNPRLVRGLDYYCHSAFEFKTDRLGAQDTLMGGGRYDGLVEIMGGPPTPGVGWAAGIERMALLLSDPETPVRPFALVPLGGEAERRTLAIAHGLRRAGLVVDLGYAGNLKKRMQRANKINARAAILIGDDELAQEAATVKNLETGVQEIISFDALIERLSNYD
jgi:histidyl-tRNA synthetase